MLYFLQVASEKKLPAGARRGVFGGGLECEFAGTIFFFGTSHDGDDLIYGLEFFIVGVSFEGFCNQCPH